ncbi:MAG: DUF4276 family protein [Candidatus Omnitrophota bacterium]|jgi:hypothetical protein|nr:MAG: DUF4276 family protein [Candidatus Omnitrophota bacterium]
MHFEILVEDISGKTTLDILVPKIIGDQHTFRVVPYKGIGRIPKNLKSSSAPNKRILLDQLPRLLKGYGKTYANQRESAAVIVVCDLDDQCLKTFRNELFEILLNCNPKPETRFYIAIEEGEAWFLGDIPAIRSAYPSAKSDVLHAYINDSICQTWEKLADAIYPGGSASLVKKGYQTVGKEKSSWAKSITPFMNVDSNLSTSFCYFRDALRKLPEILFIPEEREANLCKEDE